MAKSDWERTLERRYAEGVAAERAEGWAEGRAAGRVEGIAVMVRQMFTDFLAERFGEVPAAVRQRIEGASAESIGRWTRRVATADTIDEVLAD